MFHTGFMQQLLKSQYYKIFKTLKLSYLQQNGLKTFCCYNSHEVSLRGGRIDSVNVNSTVMLAWYVICEINVHCWS